MTRTSSASRAFTLSNVTAGAFAGSVRRQGKDESCFRASLTASTISAVTLDSDRADTLEADQDQLLSQVADALHRALDKGGDEIKVSVSRETAEPRILLSGVLGDANVLYSRVLRDYIL